MEKMDKQVILDEVIIPYCEEGGDSWYPIKYIVEKFLLKGYNRISISDKCKDYTKRKIIDYTFKGTSPQETNCMNKDGWIKYLSECKLNKNKDDNKIKRHNILCDYFECKNKYIDKTENPIYDDYINDCINEITNYKTNTKLKICPKCGRVLPTHKNFFPKDDRVSDGFLNICKMCNTPNNCSYFYKDNQAREIYSLYGNDVYLLYKNDPTEILEQYYKDMKIKNSIKIANKEELKKSLLKVVKKDYINGIVKECNLNAKFILTKYKTDLKFNDLKNNEINEYCSDGHCKIKPWKYPNYNLEKISYNEGNVILNTYMEDNNIIISDILQYDKYLQLLKDSKLYQFTNKSLEFIVQYYNYEFAGYQYKLFAHNYYRYKENADFDMKYFVEKDMKIPIEKIPLYITKTSLYKNCKKLHTFLSKGYLYSSIFEWIDNCYPNIFNIYDFEINPFRNGFDSLQEAQVDEQLRNKLDNVIYNQRNTE